MQPAPDINQPPIDPTTLPTEPLVPPWQGVPDARSLTPIQSTIPPDSNSLHSNSLPPLPMKHARHPTTVEQQETVEIQESTEVETTYTTEVDAPPSSSRRQRRTHRTLRFIFVVIEILLLIRFFLKLVGANPASPFGIFEFGLTDPLAAPFASLLDNPMIGKSVIEFTTILALIMYPIFGWILGRALQLVFYREQGGQQVVRKRRRIDRENF